MYVLNITNDYDNLTFTQCTEKEHNNGISIQTLLKIPCGLSFLCLMSLMIYTLITNK